MKIHFCCLTCSVFEENEEASERNPLISDEENENEGLCDNFQEGFPSRLAERFKPETQRTLLPQPLILTIALEILKEKDEVKVYALNAQNMSNIFDNLLSTESGFSEERNIVQLRTKVLSSNARGTSCKYVVIKGVTFELKFQGECLNHFILSEFRNTSIRFRLYKILKRRRDRLLGECTLDTSRLNLNHNKNSKTEIELQLSSSEAQEAGTRVFSADKRLSSNPATTCTGKGNDRSTSNEDEEYTSRKAEGKHAAKTLGRPRTSKQTSEPSNGHSFVHIELNTNVGTGPESLRTACFERDKVNELQGSANQMESNAANLLSTVEKLRQKYSPTNH